MGSTRPLCRGPLHPPETSGKQPGLSGGLHPPEAMGSTRPLCGVCTPLRCGLTQFPRAQQQQQMPLCLLSGACCQDNARSCQSRHRDWLLCQLHGVWGPAGGCLSPGWWNLPAPLGVWGRGAEFTTVTVLSEKPSKDVGSLEAMSVSHPLAVGRHVEF